MFDGEFELKAMKIILIIIAIAFVIGIIFVIITVQQNPRKIEENANQRDLEIFQISKNFKKYEGERAGSNVKALITQIIENNEENPDYILYFNGKSKKSDLLNERNNIISSVKYEVIISAYYGNGYIKEFRANASN